MMALQHAFEATCKFKTLSEYHELIVSRTQCSHSYVMMALRHAFEATSKFNTSYVYHELIVSRTQCSHNYVMMALRHAFLATRKYKTSSTSRTHCVTNSTFTQIRDDGAAARVSGLESERVGHENYEGFVPSYG